MATITITVPDNVVQAVLDSFATVYGLPDGVTKVQNARQRIRQYLKDVHRQAQSVLADQRARTTLDDARDAALAQAETEADTITVS